MFPKCFRVVCQIRVCDTVVISLVSKQQSHPDITSLCLVHNTPALHQRTTEALLSQQHPFSAFVLCLHSKVLHVNCMAIRPPPTPPPTPGVINPYAGRSIPHRYKARPFIQILSSPSNAIIRMSFFSDMGVISEVHIVFTFPRSEAVIPASGHRV